MKIISITLSLFIVNLFIDWILNWTHLLKNNIDSLTGKETDWTFMENLLLL